MDLTADPKVLETSEGPFAAKTVVLATGADPRELGLAGENALVGRGVAYCAACDGMRYKGKTVVVVGGGNSAAADALILSRIAEKVILVHRRDQLRATKVYHAPLMQAENVEFRWNSVVTELLHDEKLTGVRLKDVNTGAETVLPCDGVFISVGRKPATELVQGQLELDRSGYVVADETTETSLPGVYAVGDVRTKPLRQVVTAVADGPWRSIWRRNTWRAASPQRGPRPVHEGAGTRVPGPCPPEGGCPAVFRTPAGSET